MESLKSPSSKSAESLLLFGIFSKLQLSSINLDKFPLSMFTSSAISSRVPDPTFRELKEGFCIVTIELVGFQSSIDRGRNFFRQLSEFLNIIFPISNFISYLFVGGALLFPIPILSYYLLGFQGDYIVPVKHNQGCVDLNIHNKIVSS